MKDQPGKQEPVGSEKSYPAEVVERRKKLAALRKAGVPQVGLFFVHKVKVFAEGAPWTKAESIAGFRTYVIGHPVFWENLQSKGLVPRGLEYDEVPRGRVTFYDPEQRFTLFADKCIIKSKRAIRQIMAQLSLPSATKVERDDHYRCPGCRRRPTRRHEEEDWDISAQDAHGELLRKRR